MNVSVYAGSFVPTRLSTRNNHRRRPPAIRLPNGAALRDELFSGFSPLFIYLFFPFPPRVRPACARSTLGYMRLNVPGALFFDFLRVCIFFGYLFIYIYGSRRTIIAAAAAAHTQRQQAKRLNSEGGKRAKHL